MTFTLDEIKKAWEVYDKGTIFGLFRDGEWEYVDKVPSGPLGATKAENRKLSKAFTFPEYLEKRWKK